MSLKPSQKVSSFLNKALLLTTLLSSENFAYAGGGPSRHAIEVEQDIKETLQQSALKNMKSPLKEVHISKQSVKTKSQKPTKPKSQFFQQVELEAYPIRETHRDSGLQEKVVNAYDGRVRVTKTDTWPDSVHGVVAVTFKNATGWGTGTLIAPNVVLTAAHNFYDYKKN